MAEFFILCVCVCVCVCVFKGNYKTSTYGLLNPLNNNLISQKVSDWASLVIGLGLLKNVFSTPLGLPPFVSRIP